LSLFKRIGSGHWSTCDKVLRNYDVEKGFGEKVVEEQEDIVDLKVIGAQLEFWLGRYLCCGLVARKVRYWDLTLKD
jgi:hypothetical protein